MKMLNGETINYTTSQPSGELIKLRKVGDGPIYGCDLRIQVGNQMSQTTIHKHWVGTVSKCVRKAKLMSRFWGVIEIDANDFKHWCLAHGDPRMPSEN